MTHAPPPRARSAARRAPRSRVLWGVLFIFFALVTACAGRLIADNGHHAYDPDAHPQTSYRLSLTKQYQLSATSGVAGLQQGGLLTGATNLACSYDLLGSSVTDRPLSILSTRDDPRDLHMFATFSVPQSGQYQISCQGVSAVFVDDADNSQPGYSAALVLLACVLALIGVGLAISGLAGDFPPPGSHLRTGDPAAQTI